MRVVSSSLSLARQVCETDLCSCFSSLSTTSRRTLSSTSIHRATPTLHPTTRRDKASSSSKAPSDAGHNMSGDFAAPSYTSLTTAERAQRAAERAREKMKTQKEQFANERVTGGLADDSLFAEKDNTSVTQHEDQQSQSQLAIVDDRKDIDLRDRSIANMSLALDPNPNARARWQRKMTIRHVKHRGRLVRQAQIDRTERKHLVKSHFFKTSMKKLSPLARQIAGKSIDEAILQMRFSKKKAAMAVRAHLIQARDEAIVIKGMGLPMSGDEAVNTQPAVDGPVVTDPGISPPLPHQNSTKSIKAGLTPHETDIYVAEAWVNRGPYGMKPEFRARGRVNMLRPPWTGISVVLKEQKTRIREQAEKEDKVIRKRLGKSMWTQLPDRPVTKQSQYVLW